MGIRKLSGALTTWMSLGVLMCSVPLLSGLGWAQGILRPVERIPRDKFGVVGGFPLDERDLRGLIFPSATAGERQALLEGLKFFTTPHPPEEGAGPDPNQPFCLGCHTNSAEVPRNSKLGTASSHSSRAARSTPTNFDPDTGGTSLDPATGGGRAPDQDEVVDPSSGAITGTGRTAAFTIFGDFKPSTGAFNSLSADAGPNSPNFGGFVQHVRPSLAACLPDRIPPISIDPNLHGVTVDPATRFLNPPTGISLTGFRRTTGERAAPPYVGRGLMEAIPDADILTLEDPLDAQGHNSPLDNHAAFPECRSHSIAGRSNQNVSNLPSGVVGGDLPARADGGTTVRLGRFGLRAAGPTLVQFVV